jgi:hypothetical protein
LTKHAGKAKQSGEDMRRSKQTQANLFLGGVYDALLSLDVNAALNFIKKPYSIKFCNTYNTKYGLHALLVLLAANTHNWSDILNEMSDLELKNLKECVSDVQYERQPKADLTKRYLLKNIFDMADDQDLNLSQIIAKMNTLPFNKKIRAKTMFIVMTVAESWDVVTKELNDLSGAIDTFKRAPRQVEPVVAKPEKSITAQHFETWTTEELRQKMGYKNLKVLQSIKSQVLNQHPERRGEIKSWFSKNGKFFIAKYFKDFQSLCQANGKSGTKKSAATGKLSSANATALKTATTVLVETPVIEDEVPIATPRLKPNTNFDKKSETQPENKATFDQVAIVGIQTFVQGFLELCENRNKKAAEYTATMDAANSETDLIKRGALLERAIEINRDLSVLGAKFETDSVIYDKISQPLQDRENAIKQLDAANSTLSNIWQEIKQNIK